MEDKTDTFMYEMDVKPKEPEEVTIEVKQVPIEGEPLVELDTSKKYLLDAGKEVLQKLRDFTLKPDAPKVDETFVEKNPFEGPIRRTQIPIYQEDVQRMRPVQEEEEPDFVFPNKLDQKVTELFQRLPNMEDTIQTIQENYYQVIDWSREKIASVYGKAQDYYDNLTQEKPQDEDQSETEK